VTGAVHRTGHGRGGQLVDRRHVSRHRRQRQRGGPYVFSGFPEPALGQVLVTLMPGNIKDAENIAFQADDWLYQVVPPTPPRVQLVEPAAIRSSPNSPRSSHILRGGPGG